MFFSNNEMTPMTRRYPNLKKKQFNRDAAFARRLVQLWDEQKDPDACFDWFVKEWQSLSPERYWETLRTIWILCGTVERIPIFMNFFRREIRSCYYFSTPEEAEQLRKMPDQFEVHRATNDENDGGISWTTSLGYAERYCLTYHKKKVISRTISKSQVFAFIDRNRESEILIF